MDWLIILIQTDKFLLLDGAVWAQLWSGIFGSVIGAVSATAVALVVVVLSNNHQSRLAAAALREQQRLASQAIDEQRRLANTASIEQSVQASLALSEQREALRLQLSEQKSEASRERQYAAVSQFLAAASRGKHTYQDGEGLNDLLSDMEAAVLRWGLDMDSADFRDELRMWPSLLWKLLKTAHLQHVLASEGKIAEDEGPAYRVNKGLAVVTTAVTNWHGAVPIHRDVILRKLAEARDELEKQSLEFVSGLPRATQATPSGV